MDENATPPAGGLSRRDLLKRAATVGAAAWTIPIVSTFNAPAFAQAVVSPPPCAGDDWECGDDVIECGEGAGGFLCVCDVTVEGDVFCWNDAGCGVGTFPCETTANCPDGWGCVTNCCGTYCFPPCGTLATPEAAFDSRSGQRTGAGR